MIDKIKDIEQINNNDEFNSLLNDDNNKNILIYFCAIWCNPCKNISNILNKINNSRKYKDLKIYKIDVDNKDTAEIVNNYNIRGVPALILFNEKQPKANHVGSATDTQINAFIHNNI